MLRITSALGIAVLGLALLASSGISQQERKSKGQLPSGWGKLGLTKEQKTKIYAVQSEYRSKINDLEKQVVELRTQERRAMVKILTDEQKEKLKSLAIGETSPPRKEK